MLLKMCSLFEFSEMVTIVSQTASNYEKLEMNRSTEMLRNFSIILEKHNSIVMGSDVRTAVAIIKLKNDVVSTITTTEHALTDKLELVKKDINEKLLSLKGENVDSGFKEQTESKESVIDGLFYSTTVNFVDGKMIIALSSDPASIFFVLFVLAIGCAFLIGLFFIGVICYKKCCTCSCKKTTSKNAQPDEVSLTTTTRTFSEYCSWNTPPPKPKKVSKPVACPKPPNSSEIPTASSSIPKPPPPPPPPRHPDTKLTTINIEPKKVAEESKKVERSTTFSFGDMIPKMNPDGTVRRPSQTADPRIRKSIPNTRPLTQIVDGNIVVVKETSF
jgi:hypothetical protein